MFRKLAIFGAAAGALSSAAHAQDETYLSEVRTFSASYCPRGWAPANGQLLPINTNQALFALLGTTYGGDGRVNFALPDFRGRVNLGAGQGPGLSDYAQGELGGVDNVTLTAAEHPVHTHAVADLGVPPAVRVRRAQGALASARELGVGGTIASGPAGGGQAHSNLQPYLAMTTCIALQGVFPSQN